MIAFQFFLFGGGRPGQVEAGASADPNAIFDHWLAGETTNGIAEKSHLDRSTIDDIVTLGSRHRPESLSLIEQPPIYNVWNYGSCDPRFGQKHPGQIPGQAVVMAYLLLKLDIMLFLYLGDLFFFKENSGSHYARGVPLPVQRELGESWAEL